MTALIYIPILVWAFGQGLKFLIKIIKRNRFDLQDFFDYGGMPSTHSAMVASLSTLTALELGVRSPIFAITIIFSLFIIHDALRLRNVLADHSKIINQLRNTLPPEQRIKYPEVPERIGHKLPEVAVGLILGIAMTLILNLWLVK
ncbi:MAG: divergent PAP2 family protein [bacterium]|nr:divergent PAP2 family protein [bacterium]